MTEKFNPKVPKDKEQTAAQNGSLTELQQNAIAGTHDLLAEAAQKFVDRNLLPIRRLELQEGFDANRKKALDARPSEDPETPPQTAKKNTLQTLLGWLNEK